MPIALLRIVGCTLVALLAIGVLPAVSVDATATDVERLAGPDRFATAAAIAREAFDRADTALLVGRDGVADALSAAALAREVDGPILLVDREMVPPSTRAVLQDLGVQRVVLLGGTAVIGDAVAVELRGDYAVERIAGATRHSTAAAIVQRVGPGEIAGQGTVLIAGDDAVQEAVAAAPLSYATGAPLLLTDEEQLSAAAREALQAVGAERVIVLGNERRVRPPVIDQLAELGVDVQRLAGADELDSAALIAMTIERYGLAGDRAVIARGDDIGDALTGGVLAGMRAAPIVLTGGPDDLGSASAWFAGRCSDVQEVIVLGGPGAVGLDVIDQALQLSEECRAPRPLVRDGLHVTAAELALWRERAAAGPYRRDGDVRLYSPGDWQRITDYAEEFLADPDRGRWAGPVANNPGGCVQVKPGRSEDLAYSPPYMEATRLRDAAFVAMVADSREHAVAAKSELVAQARDGGVDFGDRERWCLGVVGGDNHPVFEIANWLSRLLFAYDYLQISWPEVLSDQDRSLLDRWFADAAVWMQEGLDRRLDELFVDRSGGNYQLTSLAQDWWRRLLYLGGPEARTLQRRYNNRAATAARFVALVGIAQDNESFKESGRDFVREVVAFAYFPQGVLGEFERWTEQDPIEGWRYAMLVAGSVVTIADAFARDGDPSLYDFETTYGALGTQGTRADGDPKSIRSLVADLLGYVDLTYERYGTDDPDREGDPSYRIDSIAERTGDEYLHDVHLALANRYYRDPYIASVYLRTSPRTPAYPAVPKEGQGDPEGGEWGIYPGVMFMFGGLEASATDPYHR